MRNVHAVRQLRPQRHFAATAYRAGVIDSAKDLLSKANKKTGEVLADGMEKAEEVTPTAETVKSAADKANKKTGEVLADGMEKAEGVAQEAKGAAKGVKEKARVNLNHKGYDSLQDKGAKAESEQNRPDDGV